MVGIYLKLCALLQAVYVVSSFADSTLNKPGCSSDAFIGDEKYLTCRVDSNQRPALEKCLNSSLEAPLPAGSRLEWCLNSRTTCISNSSLQSSSFLPQLDVQDNGTVRLRQFTFNAPMDGVIECSYYNREGLKCTPTVNVALQVHRPPYYGRPSVVIGTIDRSDLVATIGRNFSLCVSVFIRGVNGTPYWQVGDTRVNATVITTPVNVETYVPPDCLMCSCMKKKYEAELGSGIASSDSPEYRALVVSFHRHEPNRDPFYRREYLCNFPDTTLALVAANRILPTPEGRITIKLVMTDILNRTLSHPLEVTTVYEQVANDAKVYPLSSPSLVLKSGDSAIVYCNATTAGDTSQSLAWAQGSPENLIPIIDAYHSRWETPAELCTTAGSGVYHLLMPSELGRDLELDNEGAMFLLQRGALLVCGAHTSFSGPYMCFVNSSDGSSVILQISKRSESLPTVAKVFLGVLAVVAVTAFALLLYCVWRCRSGKRAPRQMAPCHNQPLPSQHRVSATNQFFLEETFYEQEFSREKLQLLKVLGEGQFGQVWKAVAEGICPQDTNRTIVAVKTLKPNAGWSDKEDLQSELSIMMSIEPHPSIINFLGMCPETEHEPLYILMEFAKYGSLKDYLKNLSLGKAGFSHPLQVRACSCSCHPSGPRASASLMETADSPSPTQRPHPRAVPVLSVDSFVNNPEEATHAARLLSLLDSNFDPPNSGECLDKLSEGSSECSCESGCCAYHPCAEEYDYDYYCGGRASDYYNSYYNHSEDASRADGRPVCAGEGKLPPISSPPPNYVNIAPGNNEDCRYVGKCACSCEERHYMCDENIPDNEYRNISSTGCADCVSPDKGAGSGTPAESCTECSCGNDRSDSRGKLSYFEFLDYAHQIARGMEHLENMKCVHRDLAARNVLIAEKFRLKIGDFGLTRDLSGENYYRKRSSGKIPARWMAVESLTEMKHTPKSDVWSYGVVLWEILTCGELPYGKTPMARSIESLASFLMSGRRLSQPPPCSAPTYEIMKKCWHCDPGQRPSFTQLAESFRLVLQKSPGHFNRNIDDVPRQPRIAKLESDIFQALIPVLSTHNPVSQQLSDASQLPPAYEEALLMTRSAVSSTDSGCHMSYLDQSPGENSSAAPIGSNYCTSPSQPCSSSSAGVGEAVASAGLTEQDYLTLCQRDDQIAGSGADSQEQRQSIRGGDGTSEDNPGREGVGSEREAERGVWRSTSCWQERMDLCEPRSSLQPERQTSVSNSNPPSRKIWNSIETEV